jgi:hypothetical protein
MATDYNPSIVTDGLELCFDAANTKSYPGSGTTWTDMGSKGIDGTLTNGPTFDSGNIGTISFDGSNDVVDLNSTLSSIASHNLPASWESWVYFNTSTANQTIIGNAFVNGGVLLRTTGTSHSPANRIRWVYFQNGGNGTGVDSAVLTSGWYQFVATYNGSGLSHSNFGLYINGVAAAVTDPTFGSPSTIPQTQDFGIGGLPDESAGSYYWAGKIAIVRVYSKLLSATEVLQNYNANKGRFGL